MSGTQADEGHGATSGTQYRAVCEEGDFTGICRDTADEAAGDALEHQEEQPDHIVGVESCQ